MTWSIRLSGTFTLSNKQWQPFSSHNVSQRSSAPPLPRRLFECLWCCTPDDFIYKMRREMRFVNLKGVTAIKKIFPNSKNKYVFTVMVIDWASVGTKLDVHASGPSWCFNTLGNSFLEPLASIEGIFGELIYPFDFPVLPGKIKTKSSRRWAETRCYAYCC